MNIWTDLIRVLGSKTTKVGTIALKVGNSYLVNLVGGGDMMVTSTATDLAVGNNVYIQGTVITGKAPDLTMGTITI